MMPGQVYVWRTRKPGAILGLPIIGRHFGYGGQTRNPKMRDVEHLEGGGRYGHTCAPWSDLAPKKYVVFKMKHCPQWLLNTVEFLVIKLLFPVYNHAHNLTNPRRIPIPTARAQRVARDARGWCFNVRGTLGPVAVLLLAAAVYLWSVR